MDLVIELCGRHSETCEKTHHNAIFDKYSNLSIKTPCNNFTPKIANIHFGPKIKFDTISSIVEKLKPFIGHKYIDFYKYDNNKGITLYEGWDNFKSTSE